MKSCVKIGLLIESFKYLGSKGVYKVTEAYLGSVSNAVLTICGIIYVARKLWYIIFRSLPFRDVCVFTGTIISHSLCEYIIKRARILRGIVVLKPTQPKHGLTDISFGGKSLSVMS